MTILDTHEKKVESFQTSVQAALEAMKAQRAEAARSTQHGNKFEDVLAEFIEKEALKAGDIPSRTGNKTGSIKNSKVGDVVVELDADCTAAGERYVIEAKEKSGYTLADAAEEIETARKNRSACVGVFVFSRKTAPAGMETFVRHGDDIFIVWDADKIESDLILRAGLSLAKALCVRQQKERDAEEGNWNDINAAILALEKEAARLTKMKTWTETIQSNSINILDEVRKMAASLERQITILRESVEALKQA